jgi:hypothetical protein
MSKPGSACVLGRHCWFAGHVPFAFGLHSGVRPAEPTQSERWRQLTSEAMPDVLTVKQQTKPAKPAASHVAVSSQGMDSPSHVPEATQLSPASSWQQTPVGMAQTPLGGH